MIGIEKRLLERGYKCDYKPVSSLTGISNIYKKKDTEVIIGLSEKGKPPTLISHRNHFWIGNEMVTNDDMMNRVLQEKTADEIIDIIEA